MIRDIVGSSSLISFIASGLISNSSRARCNASLLDSPSGSSSTIKYLSGMRLLRARNAFFNVLDLTTTYNLAPESANVNEEV